MRLRRQRSAAERPPASILLGEARGGRGWIRQELDDQDRRVRRLSLSKKGKSVHARLMTDLVKQSQQATAR